MAARGPQAGPGPGGSASRPSGAAQASGRGDEARRLPIISDSTNNPLKRQTPFICNIRFRNDLPEIPCDPKLLVNPIRTDQLAAFALTSLEVGLRPDLVVRPDLGIPVGVLDSARYAAPAQPGALHPADAALVEGIEEGGKGAGRGARPAGRLQGDLSWLMRTTYISNDLSRRPSAAAKAAASAGGGRGEESLEITDREAQVEAIEATFAAARKPPVHPSNPGLAAAEVLPLLPDEACAGFQHVDVVFDDEPMRASRTYARADDATRAWAAAESLMTYHRRDVQDEYGAPAIVAHLLPKGAPGAQETREDGALAYEYGAEYAFRVVLDEERRTYVLALRPRGAPEATYTDLNSRLELRRPGAAGRKALASVPVPSEVRVKKRKLYPSEAAAHSQRVADYMGWGAEHAEQLVGRYELEEEPEGAAAEEEPEPESVAGGSDGGEQPAGLRAPVPRWDSEDDDL